MVTKIIKIKLKDLKNNPFQGNELDDEQVERLVTSMKGVGFLGMFEVQENPKTKEYHLVFGHHRRGAATNLFGKDHIVEAIVRDWNEEKLMRGKLNENLTATKDPKRLIREVSEFREYLKRETAVQNPDSHLKDGRKTPPQNLPQPGSLDNMCEWLNKFGTIMSRSNLADLLKINDNLAPELKKKLDKGATNTEEDDEHINLTNAAMLAKLDDHKEQKEIWKALKDSSGPRMHRVRTRQKIITQYKELKKKAEDGKDENAKKEIDAIRTGKKDIAAVGIGTGYNKDNVTPITTAEVFIKVEDSLYKAQEEMKSAESYIDKANNKILEKNALFLKSFAKDGLGPFSKKIFTKLKGGLYFTITNNE